MIHRCARGEMLRRARGYVPDALPPPPGDIPPLLALGADMKIPSGARQRSGAEPALGDLGEEGVEQQWRSALQLMQSITRLCRSGWWLMPIPAIAQRSGRPPALPLETVLHHHAHAAACGGAPPA